MNIPRMYTIALGSFGYTEDEARFLYLVATHSGYFTCQQFVRFINGKPGKRSLTFVRKLVEQGFGWHKTVGTLRKLHQRGRERVSWLFAFTSAAYNLVRLRTLLSVSPA